MVTGKLLLNADADADADADNADDGRLGYGNSSSYFQYSELKITHFGNVMSIDMTLTKWVISTMGVYGEMFCLLSDSAEISFLTPL